MPTSDIPARVRRFLARDVWQVTELEVLLLLHASPLRYWGQAEVSEQMRLTRESAAGNLEALARRNLLDVRLGEEIRYRYSPIAGGQADTVEQLAALWRSDRATVIMHLMKTRRSLQDFSDAFRLTQWDDDDG